MKHRTVILAITALLFALPAFSDLQDWEFNVNGTDYFPANGDTFSSVPGLNSSAFNSTSGLGTLTLTFNPGSAGNYYVGAFFFDPVATPFYNEYSAVNGSAAAGQSWQIDIPQYDATSLNHGNGTIVDNLAAEALDNTNHIPGTTSNYLSDCGANGGGAANASCNDLVSMAQGFNFTLASNQEEVITLVLSSNNPGRFTLEDIHPVDGSNATAADIFYSGSAVTQPVGVSPVPEPASWTLLAGVAGVLAFALRRRAFRA